MPASEVKPVPPANAIPTPPRRSPLAGFPRLAGTLVLLFALLFAGYYLYTNVLNLKPANVYVVRRGLAISSVYGTVTISANYAIMLFAQNTGYLHLAIKGTPNTLNGFSVKRGDLLGTVVDDATQRLYEQAQRDFNTARDRQQRGPTVAQALQSAKATVAAYEKLVPGAVPRVTVDTAKGEVIRLQNAFDAEAAELQHILDVASGTLKTYEEQVKRMRVEAPFDGILTFIGFGDGAYVQINSALFTVATPGMFVSGEVNEEDVGALKNGMKAELRLYAYPNTSFNATVAAVLPSPTEPNGSRYSVTLGMDHPPDNLRYGLTGEMNIILGRKPNAIIIPTRALNDDQVLIVDHGVVEQRAVTVGFKNLEYAEILEGINEGNQVIVSDQDAFRTGERVRPVLVNAVKPRE